MVTHIYAIFIEVLFAWEFFFDGRIFFPYTNDNPPKGKIFYCVLRNSDHFNIYILYVMILCHRRIFLYIQQILFFKLGDDDAPKFLHVTIVTNVTLLWLETPTRKLGSAWIHFFFLCVQFFVLSPDRFFSKIGPNPCNFKNSTP